LHRGSSFLLNSSLYWLGKVISTYHSDKINSQVKNIILIIGDGNGLSKISAATLSNYGYLSLTQLKFIGIIKTQSVDDFTTASSATAIAIGEKTHSRSIGTDVNRTTIENIIEFLSKYKYNTDFITFDNVAGATQAAFIHFN